METGYYRNRRRDFFDNRLEKKISNLFSQNQVTPSGLYDSLLKVHADADGWLEAIHSLADSLDRLNIGSEELLPGECELGVTIPRTFVNDQLERFSSELSQLNSMFGVFEEITTGSRSGFKVKTISSSDLNVYLEAVPAVGACIATTVSKIVELYKSLLEIRKLQSELKAQGVPPERLKSVYDYADKLMTEGLAKIADDTIAGFEAHIEDGRKNEIKTELRITLKRIAARIDRGFNIEVRMDAPKDTQEDGVLSETDTVSSYEAIKHATQNMQFIKLGGDPILNLPNGDKNPDSSENQSGEGEG